MKITRSIISPVFIFALVLTALTLFASVSDGDDGISQAIADEQTWVTISIVLGIVGMGLIVLCRDKRILELEKEIAQKNDAIEKAQELYRSLVESTEDFLFTVDKQGRFQSLNSFTAVFFGGTPAQFIGKPLHTLFSEDVSSQLLRLVDTVFQFGKSTRHEYMVTTGEYEVWLNANLMPLKNERGDVVSVLCIARDITDQKKLENQLINMVRICHHVHVRRMGTRNQSLESDPAAPSGGAHRPRRIVTSSRIHSGRLNEDIKAFLVPGLWCGKEKWVIELS